MYWCHTFATLLLSLQLNSLIEARTNFQNEWTRSLLNQPIISKNYAFVSDCLKKHVEVLKTVSDHKSLIEVCKSTARQVQDLHW